MAAEDDAVVHERTQHSDPAVGHAPGGRARHTRNTRNAGAPRSRFHREGAVFGASPSATRSTLSHAAQRNNDARAAEAAGRGDALAQHREERVALVTPIGPESPRASFAATSCDDRLVGGSGPVLAKSCALSAVAGLAEQLNVPFCVRPAPRNRNDVVELQLLARSAFGAPCRRRATKRHGALRSGLPNGWAKIAPRIRRPRLRA